MKFKIGNQLLIVRNPFQLYKLPFLSTWGITNKVGDKYLLFLDYDHCDLDVIESDIKYLQRYFNAGHALIRISSLYNYKDTEVGSYHVYFFYLYDFATVRKLINLTRCDDSFKRGYRYQARCFVLRLGEKLASNNQIVKPFTVYKELILQKHDGRGKIACNALINLFEKIDDIELKKHFKKIDSTKELEFIHYSTR